MARNSDIPLAGAGPLSRLAGLGTTLTAWAERIPHALVALLARFAIATVFWRSARTKVDGFTVTDNTFFLFAEEYKVPVLPPELAAWLATVSEHLFSVLLVVGLASRLSAAALLGMTLVIQLFVYPDAWPTHILWIALLAFLIARGPGALSLDHFLHRRFPSSEAH